MPDLGVPVHRPQRQSHTGTQQWQSFEIRMRHRRAERCLLKAEAAIDAGMEEDARAALDEARALNADVPSFEDLLAASHARRRAALEAMARARVRRASAGAAALALIGFTGLWSYQRLVTRPPAPTAETAAAPVQPVSPAQPAPDMEPTRPVETTGSAVAPADSPAPAGVPAAREEAGPRAVEPSREPVAVKRPQVETPESPRSVDPPAAGPTPASPPDLTSPPPPVPTTGDAVAVQPLARTAAVEGIGTAVSAPSPPVSRPLPTAPAPEVSAAPPATAESQEAAVRRVLARFEAAYSALSASAAQQVWPSVDVRSLARAFDDLDSQQVSLGNCAVAIAAATARADCSGSTTWTPRVGGGSRTQRRRWQFELALANGAWHIVGAQAR